MTILLYLLFNLFLFLLFRGLIVSTKIYSKREILVDDIQVCGLPLHIFYPVLALFFIGNISILFNFFIPVKNLIFFWLILFLILLVVNFKEPISIKNKTYLAVSLLIIPAILAISSYGLKFHFDTIDTHLNFQFWLRESKVVFGLTNLYIVYGWSNIYEYIIANFWYKNSFLGLHFVNIVFFTFFYNFIFYNLAFSRSLFLKFLSLNITLYSFLDNFGINGGANGFVNIQMVGKPDEAVGIMFFISFVIFLNDYLKNNFTKNNFLFLCTISLFTFQLKIFGGLLIIPLIIYLLKLKKQRFTKNQLIYFLSLIFLTITYFLKNLIISGCLIFPIKQTCFVNLPWSNSEYVEKLSTRVMLENNAFRIRYNFYEWFDNWINSAYNFQVYSNFLISLIFILIFNLLFFKKNRNQLSINELVSYLLIVLIVLTFFVTGPQLRYGFGMFLIVISSYSIKEKHARNVNYFQKLIYVSYFILFLSIGLTPRLYSYTGFLANPTKVAVIEDSTNEYLNFSVLKNLEIKNVAGSICYIPKSCIRNEKYKSITYKEKYGYKFYE